MFRFAVADGVRLKVMDCIDVLKTFFADEPVGQGSLDEHVVDAILTVESFQCTACLRQECVDQGNF